MSSWRRWRVLIQTQSVMLATKSRHASRVPSCASILTHNLKLSSDPRGPQELLWCEEMN